MKKKLILVCIAVTVLFTGCGQQQEVVVTKPRDTAEQSNLPGNSTSGVTGNKDPDTGRPGDTGSHANGTTGGSVSPGASGSTIPGSTPGASTSQGSIAPGTTSKAPISSSTPPISKTGQTLRYWVNFPTEGEVKSLTSHSFTVKTITNGVTITAYNKDGSQNKGATLSSLGTYLNSYEILDSTGKVLKSGDSKAKASNFTMKIAVSGGAASNMGSVTFKGYYKAADNKNEIIVYSDSTASFKITGASAWTYSSTYSKVPGAVSVSRSGNILNCTAKFIKGKTVNAADLSGTQFVYTPNDTVNNGLPTMIINIDNWNDYLTMTSSKDKADKDVKASGSYAMVEGTSKTYNTVNQTGTLEMKLRGFSSFDFPKKSYTIELSEQQTLTNMKANKDWVLAANYSDKSLLRNYFAYNIGRKMGTMYVPECRNVEVYIGSNGGCQYLGTYLLVEKIEVAKSKINITEMTSADKSIGYVSSSSSKSKILAGSFLAELESFDRFSGNDMGVRTNEGTGGVSYPLNIKSPDKKVFAPYTFTPLDSWTWPYPNNATQNENLAEYISSFFTVVDDAISYASDDTRSQAERDLVFEYIDINSFVDYYIVNELAKNVDGNLRLSTYFYKDKGGKLKIAIWDFDISFGNCNYGDMNCGDIYGLYIQQYATWYRMLMRNTTFSKAVKNRWAALRKSGGILSDANMTSVINSEASKLTKSANSNFNKWDILGKEVWPNPWAIIELETYKENTDYFIKWTKDRAEWLDGNIGIADR